ncbi:Rz1-like lysis system protein LysC [Mixta intestinalis]|uniref:Rz1-like lysis system protein LysC n=1 Tax=Mixta intestinalis TaxID=1615494 RepID=UPI003CC6E365
MRSKPILVLLSLCQILLLSSCAQRPLSAPLLRLPPETLFQPCEQPLFTGKSWGDAVSYSLQLQHSLKICAERIDRLIEWRRQVSPLPVEPL